MALEWTDVDLARGLLCVQRNEWEGQVDSTKGGRLRYVPMTARLATALREERHLRGQRVLCRENGKCFTENSIALSVMRAARRAGLPGNGPHHLRHPFCSHLAMRGAAPKAIQDLAGHAHISTTQRYLHLSPAALDQAIRLLEAPGISSGRGNQRGNGYDRNRELQLCHDLVAEKGGSRTLRGPYDPQTGFEDQQHHRALSFPTRQSAFALPILPRAPKPLKLVRLRVSLLSGGKQQPPS